MKFSNWRPLPVRNKFPAFEKSQLTRAKMSKKHFREFFSQPPTWFSASSWSGVEMGVCRAAMNSGGFQSAQGFPSWEGVWPFFERLEKSEPYRTPNARKRRRELCTVWQGRLKGGVWFWHAAPCKNCENGDGSGVRPRGRIHERLTYG